MNVRSSTTNSSKHKAQFKIVVMGERGVGKTTCLKRYDQGHFVKTCAITLDIQSFYKEIPVGSEKISVQIWDTVGQQKFQTLVKSYYSKACCVIIVYSDPLQLNRTLDHYAKEIDDYGSEGMAVMVLRTKIDVQQLSEQEILSLEDFKLSGKLHLWMEISSVTGHNVQKFFCDMAAMLYEKYEQDYQFRNIVTPINKKSLLLNKQSIHELQETNKIRKSTCCSN